MTDVFAKFREDETPKDKQWSVLEKLVEKATQAQDDVERLTKELKNAQEGVKTLIEHEIPNYMLDNLGVSSFENKNGLKINVDTKIRASIGNRKALAFAWLDENGHSALIKRTVVVAFNKDQGDEADSLLHELEPKLAGAKQDMKVEAATLTSWVKGMLANGDSIPHDIFGVFEQRVAKIIK